MDEIRAEEPIARFIVESNKIRPSDGTVKPKAFMPLPNLTTSVFRTHDLGRDSIIRLGQSEVAGPRDKNLIGWAGLLVNEVRKSGLDVEAAPQPHERHANIINWPMEKEAQQLAALKLSASASLEMV